MGGNYGTNRTSTSSQRLQGPGFHSGACWPDRYSPHGRDGGRNHQSRNDAYELPLQAPFLGEHNEEILTTHLSYTADQVRQLQNEGVLNKTSQSDGKSSPIQMLMKQVIVVNAALRLPKGKLAAQVAHAAVGAFLEASAETQRTWLEEGMPKVVLKGNSAEELMGLQTLAMQRHIPACLINDAGRTVVPAGTVTCVGLGPAGDNEIDELTGTLKLLS